MHHRLHVPQFVNSRPSRADPGPNPLRHKDLRYGNATVNPNYENVDRDRARVQKKNTHENMRRDRKHVRNVVNELRYMDSHDDDLDVDVETFERFRRR